MKKNVFMMMAVAGLLFASCASKKQLVECQTQNQTLTSDLQSVKEELAAKNVRVISLEEQLAAQKQALEESKKAYAAVQRTLDKSLTSLDEMDLCWQSNVSVFEYAVYVGHNFPSKE